MLFVPSHDDTEFVKLRIAQMSGQFSWSRQCIQRWKRKGFTCYWTKKLVEPFCSHPLV